MDPPTIPSVDELYDMLMASIEPDLISENVPLLKEKYKDETPKQKERRKNRYNDAFKRYYESLNAYLEDLHTKVRSYNVVAMHALEEDSRTKEESSFFANFDSAIATA